MANNFGLLLAAWPGSKISEAARWEIQRSSRAGFFWVYDLDMFRHVRNIFQS